MPRPKGSKNKTFDDRFREDYERGMSLISGDNDTTEDDDTEEPDVVPEIKEQERDENVDDDGEELQVDMQDDDESEAGTYHCTNCKYDGIERGTPSCPACGATFDWSGVE